MVDTSALVAIVLNEPERESLITRIRQTGIALVSSVSAVEMRMVLFGRRGMDAVSIGDALLAQPMFQVTPPGPEDVEAAFAAFLRYGKGRGHPARLNLGDVFSYALAKTRGLPLLFKGEDFARTDIAAA